MANLGAAAIPIFACVVLLVVMILQVLSFASPYWASVDGEKYTDFGLWKYINCKVPMKEECFKVVKEWEVGDWLMAVRGLESVAIIFWAFPIVIIPVYLYVALGLYYRIMMAAMTLLTLMGSVCNIVGVIIFGAKIEDKSSWDVGWCLIVAGVAGALGFLAFAIFLLAIFIRPVFSAKTHLMSGFYVDPYSNKMYVVENGDELKPGPLDGGHVNPAMED